MEKKPLLQKDPTSPTPTTISSSEQVDGSSANDSPKPSAPTAVTSVSGTKKGTRGSKKTKPKLPSLHESCASGTMIRGKNSQEEEDDPVNSTTGQKREPCPQCVAEAVETTEPENITPKVFGVKSYLHQFYEKSSPICEEDYHYLIQPKSRKCSTILFKIGLITGSTLFLLGAIAIIIGYTIPRQDEIRGQTDEYRIIDRNAIRFNRNLDTTKLIGLGGFCTGGLILVISFLTPTFTSSYWDDQDPAIEPFRVPISPHGHHHGNSDTEQEPKSPIPFTEKIQCIQPVWNE